MRMHEQQPRHTPKTDAILPKSDAILPRSLQDAALHMLKKERDPVALAIVKEAASARFYDALHRHAQTLSSGDVTSHFDQFMMQVTDNRLPSSVAVLRARLLHDADLALNAQGCGK